MDWLAAGKAILDAGGWACFFGLLSLIAVTGYRRVWVWGWMFDRSETRGEKAETQAERNSETLESQAQSYAVMARSYDRLERDFDRLTPGSVNRD